MKAGSNGAAEVEWYRAIAKVFRAVQRDAQAIAQGAKDLPSDGAFAMDSQLEAEFVRLAPDASAPLLAELARVGDTLRGLAWWQERIDDWKPATPQGEILCGLVANALDGLEGMRGEDAQRLRRGRVDLICRQIGGQLAAASAEKAVEAEHRADKLLADDKLQNVTEEREKAKKDADDWKARATWNLSGVATREQVENLQRTANETKDAAEVGARLAAQSVAVATEAKAKSGEAIEGLQELVGDKGEKWAQIFSGIIGHEKLEPHPDWIDIIMRRWRGETEAQIAAVHGWKTHSQVSLALKKAERLCPALRSFDWWPKKRKPGGGRPRGGSKTKMKHVVSSP